MQEHTTGTITFNIPSASLNGTQNAATPQFLTVKDCAKILKYSYGNMWELLTQDDGPQLIYVTKRHILIAYSDFMKWLEKRKR